MSNIRKWADEHQFVAPPIQAERTESGGIIPKVHLLWMTPDPLGAVSAMCRMYKGQPTYSLLDIQEEERISDFDNILKSHLKAPLEAVKLHFFIEGVSRAFTHQMVRQRTAVYAQESLRFAVKEDFQEEMAIPPSILGLSKKDPRRQMWDETVQILNDRYNHLVANGIPAEDARAIIPHGITTRLHYVTDLRNLAEHAGNRLCTQAQFEWRIVFMGVVNAIRNFGGPENWQYNFIADSALFRPICYQTGKCEFKADFDRSCTIRDRVDKNAEHGVPSAEWGTDTVVRPRSAVEEGMAILQGGEGSYRIHAIRSAEWMMDPAAARLSSRGGDV